MRRSLALAAVVLVAGGALAGCKSSDSAKSSLPRPSRAFCAAAAKYDQRVQQAKLPEQIKLVSSIAEHAPRDVAQDAQTFLTALKKRQAGDKSVVDNPKIESAVNHVNRRAGQDCGWYERQGM
jgi:hypothetical protein